MLGYCLIVVCKTPEDFKAAQVCCGPGTIFGFYCKPLS